MNDLPFDILQVPNDWDRSGLPAWTYHSHAMFALERSEIFLTYDTDGTLRGAAMPTSFGEMDRRKFGLKPMELKIFHGFLFLRFQSGPQRSVALMLTP